MSADRGATMVEYALLVALLAIVLVTAWTFFATALDSSVEDSGSQLDSLVVDD